MALLFADSHDHYSGWLYATRKGWITDPSGTGGRGGGLGIKRGDWFLPAPVMQLYAGTAYRTEAFGNQIIMFMDPASRSISAIQHVGDGRLYVTAGGLASGLAPNTVIHLRQWYYFEFRSLITLLAIGPPATYSLTYEARLNEQQILAGVLGPIAYPDGRIQAICYQAPGGGSSAAHDDTYITDDEFLGDIRIHATLPVADGFYNQLTPNAGVVHFDRVNQANPDDDATYLEGLVAGLADSQQFPALNEATVRGIGVWQCCRQGGGGADLRTLIRSGGADALGALKTSGAGYLYHGDNYRISPFTIVDFTPAELNAMEAGVITA